MDDNERAEVRAAFADAKAIGSVSIQGVVGLCAELMDAGVLQRAQLARISDFMLASLEKSGASEHMQSHLHEAIGHQFVGLLARESAQREQDIPGQDPEG